MTQNHNFINKATGTVNKVLIITRISTDHQDERSLDDQFAFCRDWAHKNLEGPCEFIHESSRGSGENLERPELQKFTRMIIRGEITHIICEESSRLCRRHFTIDFCELCEDHGVRFIAINDNLDTAKDWRVMGMFSSVKHELANKDTSNRIRRSLRNRFTNGGVIQYELFGYLKPPGAQSDRDLRKNDSLAPYVEGIFQRIEQGATFCEVADWLNQEKVPVGKHSRTSSWDNNKIRRIVTNPIYKGVRERNRKMSRRVNSSGKHRSVTAPPEELLTRECAHLRFIEPSRFDRINAMLKLRNDKYCRGRQAAKDNRAGLPRKRTVWPGQHLRCGICQSLFYWGGHGKKTRMMCAGRREYRCWNGVSCDGVQLARRILQQALQLIERLPEFPESFREQVQQEVQARRSQSATAQLKLKQDMATKERQIENITSTIADGHRSTALMQKLQELEDQVSLSRNMLSQLEAEDRLEVELPSMEELKQLAQESLAQADMSDPTTHRLLSRLFPVIKVYPYMMVDEGAVVPRVHVTMHLEALQAELPNQLSDGLVQHQLVVDLFEPPQRERIRQEAVQLVSLGVTKKEVARRLQVAPQVIDRALKLQAMLDQHGLRDAYQQLNKPPENSKLKVHEHSRFQGSTRAAG